MNWGGEWRIAREPSKLYLIVVEEPAQPWQVTFKLGFSNDPEKRLKYLQTGNHRRLLLVASWPGTHADERALHARLAPYRIGGEWFCMPTEQFSVLQAELAPPTP